MIRMRGLLAGGSAGRQSGPSAQGARRHGLPNRQTQRPDLWQNCVGAYPDYSWPKYVGVECAARTCCVSEVNSLVLTRLRFGLVNILEYSPLSGRLAGGMLAPAYPPPEASS